MWLPQVTPPDLVYKLLDTNGQHILRADPGREIENTKRNKNAAFSILFSHHLWDCG